MDLSKKMYFFYSNFHLLVVPIMSGILISIDIMGGQMGTFHVYRSCSQVKIIIHYLQFSSGKLFENDKHSLISIETMLCNVYLQYYKR